MKQLLGLLVCLSCIPLLSAQGGKGVRAGVSVDPDQFYFGGHLELGPIVERLWFRPNLELGLGNDLTLVALNAEFAYWIPLERTSWKAYLGGGPALNIFSFDGRRGRDSDAEAGLNFLVGMAHRKGFFGEVKIGALDSPTVKLGVGYTWE